MAIEEKEKIINMRQTSKYQNGKVLFELNDDLKRAGFDEKEKKTIRDLFGKIHARYSGFRVVARDYSNGRGDKLIDLDLRLGPEEVKTISENIFQKIVDRKHLDLDLETATSTGKYFKTSINEKKQKLVELSSSGTKEQIETCKEELGYAKMSFSNAQFQYQFTKQKIELMSEQIFTEQKIAPNTIGDTQYSKVTNLIIEYNTKMNIPWTIIVENGEGIREQTSTGGYKIKSGSYRNGKRVKLFLSNNDIRKLFRKAADYTLAWESTNQGAAAKQRHEFETKDRADYLAKINK